MIPLCGQILVSRKLAIRDDPNIRLRRKTNDKNTCFTDENTPHVSTQTRPRVYAKNVPVCTGKHVCALCRHTRGRFERTHGDVLNGHTGFFSVSHHTPHTPHRHTHHNTRHNTTRRQTEKERDRERDTETEGEEGTKEKKTRQEQREERRVKREKIHFQRGGAWPLLVDGVLGLVHPVKARFLHLLNRVKYDSSLISFSAPWQVNSFEFLRIIYSMQLQFSFKKKKLLVMQLQFEIFQN